jgi:hypothetical protein
MLNTNENRKVALLIEAKVVRFLITIKYGMRPIKIKRVNGNGKGGNANPKRTPLKIKSSQSFFNRFFSSGDFSITLNIFNLQLFFF